MNQRTLSKPTMADRAAGSVPMPNYEFFHVAGLNSIAHLVPRSKGRCGINVLRFRNGDHYVGQAVDVSNRFGTHRRTYPGDILELGFRRVTRERLNVVERSEILRIEHAGVPLRNVVGPSGRLDAPDFDQLITHEEQRSWLAAPRSTTVERTDDRPDDPKHRRRQQGRYDRLIADPRFSALREPLRRYVAGTIPFPARTELTYWSLSAVPTTNAGSYPRLLTLSIQTLETLFVCSPKQTPAEIAVRINVDLPALLATWGTLDALMNHMPDVEAHEPGYRTRPNLAALTVSPRHFARLLALRGILPAARRLNLDLMRKGPTMHWRTHNPPLADLAFA
jgi:hypothetical protein